MRCRLNASPPLPRKAARTSDAGRAVSSGLLVLAPSPGVMDALGWVWPPVLLALGIWMIVQVRRALHSRSRWLMYPVFGVLALIAVGGGLETIFEAVDRGGHR